MVIAEWLGKTVLSLIITPCCMFQSAYIDLQAYGLRYRQSDFQVTLTKLSEIKLCVKSRGTA